MTQIRGLEHKVQELLSLLEASKQLNSNIEMEDVFQNSLLQRVHVVGAENGTLWVLNKEQEEIIAVASYRPSASQANHN